MNRETRFSKPFLGPGDNFSRSYDETICNSRLEIQYCSTAGSAAANIGDLRSAGDTSPARAGSATGRDPPTGSGFRHNFLEKIIPGA